ISYYFHAKQVPRTDSRMRQLVALAYTMLPIESLYPRAVFVRSEVHSTTTINGRRQKDPRGDHVTFSYKTQDHLGRETHVACHGYVKDPDTLEFKEATHAAEKPDSTMKRNNKPIWPDDEDLWEAPDVGYGHMS
ncbi:uncharacterized protein B0I36DRAFT_244279, partial [Microdochium trichocladiopsis]